MHQRRRVLVGQENSHDGTWMKTNKKSAVGRKRGVWGVFKRSTAVDAGSIMMSMVRMMIDKIG